MGTTTTDTFSIVASLFGFGLAVYAIINAPVVVDSTRPTSTGNAAEVKLSEPAYARLWDDPFAVYRDAPEPDLREPQLPRKGKTLYLIVPTKTEAYEEDNENRIRIRYAIQRALFDQGYFAQPGNLLSTIEIDSKAFPPNEPAQNTDRVVTTANVKSDETAGKLKVPIQFFVRSYLSLSGALRNDSDFYESVTVVWLPNSFVWRMESGNRADAFARTIDCVKTGVDDRRVGGKWEDPGDRWVLLGPSDSDGLAFFETHRSQFNPLPSNPVAIVPYRATIANPILKIILNSRQDEALPSKSIVSTDPADDSGSSGNADDVSGSLAPIRFPNGDDVLCAELLQEILNRGSLPPHATSINVTIFAEWDTLYGRALAKTFTALSNYDQKPGNDWYPSPDVGKALVKGLTASGYQFRIPSEHTEVRVKVIPYLRGLDGASTLYRKNYSITATASRSETGDPNNPQSKNGQTIEAAEGRTQFDYIRRLTTSMFVRELPFWPQLQRPDAVIIFGTDVYDKLVLLEFLRQELRNCLYLTTDLDALYWHPHYQKFTKDLVVASAFPLRMDAASCNRSKNSALTTPIEFRDSHQSAVYMAVSRCLEAPGKRLSTSSFQWNSDSLLYRVGNTKPLNILLHAAPHRPSGDGDTSFLGIVGAMGDWLQSLIEPIIQGSSPFWSMLLQGTVVCIGLYSLLRDVPKRMSLSGSVADELWKAALIFVPCNQRDKVLKLRARFKETWEDKPVQEKPWQKRKLNRVQCVPLSRTEDIPTRVETILSTYDKMLSDAATKGDVASIGLHFLSDLFGLRKLVQTSPSSSSGWRVWVRNGFARFLTQLSERPSPEPADAAAPGLEKEVAPFVAYIHGDLTMPLVRPDKAAESFGERIRKLLGDFKRFLDRRFPNIAFISVGFISFTMLLAICAQPVPFLVGAETNSYLFRIVRWVMEAFALLITFLVFHRICYEQYRFRNLIQSLEKLVPQQEVGLSNRQLLVVIAKASEPVSNLALVPCAMIFLLYASHLSSLGGVPMAGEMSCLLGVALGTLTYSYCRLRATALEARSTVRSEYKKETVDATRLAARIRSYATDEGPMQDDERSLINDLEHLLKASSTFPSEVMTNLSLDLKRSGFRERICVYLKAVIARNEEFADQLGTIQSGLLAPLIANPIFTALIIPVGGAGGLSLIEWLVTMAR